MNYKKIILLVVIIAFFSLPLSSTAAENEETDIGIGFTDNQQVIKERPICPKETILPLTSGSKNYPERTGTLPKTGMIRTNWINHLGVLCLIAFFWLFLFTRLKEEENSWEGGDRK